MAARRAMKSGARKCPPSRPALSAARPRAISLDAIDANEEAGISEPIVIEQVHGPVGLMILNRPRNLHALDLDMLAAIEAAHDRLEAEAAVRVLVVTGSGEKAFMAGGDIGAQSERNALTHFREFAETMHRVMRRFETSDRPTIAAVNGYALGGGMELLLATDLRVMADSAQIGLTEINFGLFPGGGGTSRLMRQVPYAKANELMFTGARIGAEEAMRLGLVNRVVPAADLREAAMALGRQIAEKSPLALAMLKRTIQAGRDMPLSAALAHERAMVSLMFDAHDMREGASAFVERRKPNFEGR